MQKYSQLFGKTNKSAKEFASLNATLLQKAGFVNQTMAGVYSYLPLGKKVLAKIEQIIREEMDKVSQEVFMPAIVPTDLWATTGRLDTVDVIFKAVPGNPNSKEKNDAEYVLNSTHEDVVTPLAQSYLKSYKEFPLSVYQIQSKFRNEARPKSGLLRGREFRMKDAYSFHTSKEDFQKYYDLMKEVYTRIFERLGLGDKTVIALASGGDFTEDFSHEFQTICDAGEDLLFKVPSSGLVFNREVTPSKAPVIDNSDEAELPLQEMEGAGIIGVEELAKFLQIPVEKTTKTILFETPDGKVVAAAVRGGYEIDMEKLHRVVGVKPLKLASPETVKSITGAEVGYAGLLNLPAEVIVVMDESLQGRKNFEMGANKTNFHSTNVNFGRDLSLPEQFYDIKVAKAGDLYPETGEFYQVLKAAEVGNIFPLDTRFPEAFGFRYTDEQGKLQPIYMGCYGIGPSRVMGVITETYNDGKGIIWPKQVAPFDVHFITLQSELNDQAEGIVNSLEEEGIEVLWDERDVSPGEKFADADLIGIPARIVLSSRSLQAGGLEVKWRDQEKSEIVASDRDKLLNWLRGQ